MRVLGWGEGVKGNGVVWAGITGVSVVWVYGGGGGVFLFFEFGFQPILRRSVQKGGIPMPQVFLLALPFSIFGFLLALGCPRSTIGVCEKAGVACGGLNECIEQL